MNESPRSNDTKIAVAFFTHLFNPEIRSRYLRLKHGCQDCAEPFILCESGTPVDADLLGDTLFFEYESLRLSAAATIGNQVIPGNCHLVTLEFFRRNPGFDYYWLIEYDLVFTGDWDYFFKAFESHDADLLASDVKTREDDPDWRWWHSLTIPKKISELDFLRAFFPIYRISGRALIELEARVQDGWSGHFEALIPTVLNAAKMTISDFGGTGKYVRGDYKNRFYTIFDRAEVTFGTMRYRPIQVFPLFIKNHLYHPVKPERVHLRDFLDMLQMRPAIRYRKIDLIKHLYDSAVLCISSRFNLR